MGRPKYASLGDYTRKSQSKYLTRNARSAPMPVQRRAECNGWGKDAENVRGKDKGSRPAVERLTPLRRLGNVVQRATYKSGLPRLAPAG